MHLLFADKLPQQTIVDLEARGHVCVMEPELGADDLPSRIAGFDGLVVRSTKVKRAVFDAADRLTLVIRAGAGTNTIDTDAAAASGVFVSNVPGRNAAAVAELTMGLLLAIDRRIADNVSDLRDGHWDKKRYSKASGLLGSTMGIIGLGSIGLAVAERAAAFGIRVQSLARPGRPPHIVTRAEELDITMCGSLSELVSSSDIVSLHVPSNDETRHLVDDSFLSLMKPGAILLNTSRGDVVDEGALLKALDTGAVRAGLDVFTNEPSSSKGPWDSPLGRHPAVVATHHIGASTEQAQRAIAAGVTEVVDAFMSGEARHCVNLEPRRLGSVTLMIRHLDRVGVLAQVLDRLSAAGLNVEHMENRIFRGGEAAVASIDVAGKATDALQAELRELPHVLSVTELTLRSEAAPADGTARPFRARVVRPEWARRLVTGLAELPEDTGTLPPVAPVDPSSYDESEAALYVYRQARGDLSCTGVVTDVAVHAFVDGQVRGHEAVQAQRVESLVHHAMTDAAPALVALLHHAGPAYAGTLDEVCAGAPILDFAGPGGLRQTVWRVPPGAATASLADELTAADHYIADGHHRVAAALAAWRRSAEPADAGVLCVIHPMDGLRLSAFHRRVIGPVDVASLLDLLAAAFRVEPAGAPPLPASGSFGLYAGGSWRNVTPRAAAAGLDVEILQALVFDHLKQTVEIAPARTLVDELTRRCDADEGALFTLAPPPLETLTKLADAGAVMPPKTTYFEPKPCAGIFRRPSDAG
jgi:D-3-phosphoglycerate dehydrogenase / 2-oxoglutarate reductase